MFNFKKFAQDPDYINYLQTHISFTVTTQQLQTLYDNLGKHYSKDYIVSIPEDTLKFLCDHSLSISISKLIIERRDASYDFLEKYLLYVQAGGDPDIIRYGSIENIDQDINYFNMGLNFGNSHHHKNFKRLITSDITEDQKQTLVKIVKYCHKSSNILQLCFLILRSPGDNLEIINLLQKFNNLLDNLSNFSILTEIRENSIDSKFFCDFLEFDVNQQINCLNKIQHLPSNPRTKKYLIQYYIKHCIEDGSKFEGIEYEITNSNIAEGDLDPQFYDIAPENLMDVDRRYNRFILQLACKKITGQDNNTEYKKQIIKTQPLASIYEYISKLNPDYSYFCGELIKLPMYNQLNVGIFLELICAYTVEELNELIKTNSLNFVADNIVRQKPSAPKNKLVNDFKLYLSDNKFILQKCNEFKTIGTPYESILEKIVNDLLSPRMTRNMNLDSSTVAKLQPEFTSNTDDYISDLTRKLKAIIFLKDSPVKLDIENVDEIVNFIEQKIISEPNLYSTNQGENDSFAQIANIYHIFGNDLPDHIVRNKKLSTKLSILLNLDNLKNDADNAQNLGKIANKKWTESLGMVLLQSFLNREKLTFSPEEESEIGIEIRTNEDLSEMLETGEIDNFTTAELIIFIMFFEKDKEKYNEFLSTVNRIYRNVLRGSEEYEKLIYTLACSSNNELFGASSKIIYDIFDMSDVSINGINDYISKGWVVYNIFGKRTKDWISRFNNLHDALQPLKAYTKQEAEGLADFILSSKLGLKYLKLIISKWGELSDEQKRMDPKKLYNELFLVNIKEISAKYDPKSDEFLIEFAQAYTSDESEQDIESDSSFEQTKFIPFIDNNVLGNQSGIEVNYKVVEDAYLASQKVPLPSWANAYYEFTSNNKIYVARFLPRSDTRGILLGNYTNCCQHPFAQGATCAFYGQTQPNSCFFVVHYKNSRDIICQSWAWEGLSLDGKSKTVCFDNVEALGLGDRQKDVFICYKEIANQISEKGYNVTIGEGGSDLDLSGLKIATTLIASEPPSSLNFSFLGLVDKESKVYTDAAYQRVISKAK